MSAAAFRATYVGVKPIAGRKVVAFSFEVPIEEGDAAMSALGGLPRPDTSVWVGIARIDATKVVSAPASVKASSPKEPRKWNALPPAQQAAIRCNEKSFQRFVTEEHGGFGDADSTIEFVREFCGVASRAEIKPGTAGAEKWQLLDNEFQAWLHI